MAKSKPNRAFLEALQKDKQKRGDGTPGGAFKTPAWFFKKNEQEAPATETQTAGPPPQPGVISAPLSGKRGFQLSWFHFVGAAVLVVAAVAVVYVITHRNDPPKLATPIEAVKAGPAQNDVLDVNAGRTGPAVPGPAPIPVAPPGGDTSVNPPESAGRVVGMNYVIMQAFDTDAKANDAAEALRKAGIGCTIEKNHPYAPKWFLVVGTQGFAKPMTPEYQTYIKKIIQVSDRYAGSSKWKKLEPNAYKWR